MSEIFAGHGRPDHHFPKYVNIAQKSLGNGTFSLCHPFCTPPFIHQKWPITEIFWDSNDQSMPVDSTSARRKCNDKRLQTLANVT